jgi:adenylate cyclase class 2
MKKEIEVKARVRNKELLLTKLGKVGCVFGKEIVQEDAIFMEKELKGDHRKAMGRNVLRIRQQDGKNIFTLKRAEKDELVAIEKEFTFDNVDEMRGVLDLLGFKESVRVKKTRKKCKYGNLEICLDKVEGLGNFIEIEKITDEEPVQVQEELMNFLKSLGVQESDRVFIGYDRMMYNKKLSS